MRLLTKPTLTQAPVYAACVKGIRNPGLAARCNAITTDVVAQESVYERLAKAGQLFNWPHHQRGGDDVPSIRQVTRGELKKLYSNQLARGGSHARPYYDQIRVSAKNNICPYCGFGLVETVDHFLPKGRYSSLSVLPLNLVPSCSDCNRIKHDDAATVGSISSHPYFEDMCVVRDEWLFASIVQADVPYAEFVIATPANWPQTTSQRVSNHFAGFGLARRYAEQAAERLIYSANKIKGLVEGAAVAFVKASLNLDVQSERAATGVNSWQSSLAKALANDAWFQTEGYKRLL